MTRRCATCTAPIPETRNASARYCSRQCKDGARKTSQRQTNDARRRAARRACAQCGKEFTPRLWVTDRERYCGKECAALASGSDYRKARRVRAARQDDGTATAQVWRSEEARKRCPYCEVALTDDNRVFDHMHPLSLGGLNSAVNLVACCNTCNGRKGALPFAEWIATLKPRAAARCRALWRQRYGAPPEQLVLGMELTNPRAAQRAAERETRAAVAAAKRAHKQWLAEAPDAWVVAWFEGLGMPWRNRRLPEAERKRLQYRLDPVHREKVKAKVERWKTKNPNAVAAQRQRRAHRIHGSLVAKPTRV